MTLRSYDLDGQLIQQTLADTDRSLAYDLIGNILSIDDGFNLNSYDYDSMSRLIGATGNQYDLLYSYDKNGNRLTEDDSLDHYDYTYNTLNNQLTDKQGTVSKNYQYDPAGNTLSNGQHSYRYDGYNQLIEVVGVAGYLYNGLGQRVAKNSNGTQTLFVYDENTRLIGEYNATGQAITETVYLFGQPVAVLKGSNIYNIHTDHLGSPRKISNQMADVIWQWQDKPFGDSAVNQDPDGDGVAFEYNLRFAGQYFDRETGLHYNYFRYYDPSTGRYITSDPIGLQGGLNTYSYVYQNPIRFTDPLGLFTAVIHVDGVIPHSALYISGEGRTPFLYDPAGSYQQPNGQPRGSGDFFEGDAANISDYINYHNNNGDTVNIYPIPTTPAQEQEIMERAIEQGGAAPFFCSSFVSGALGGVCGVEPSGRPGQLGENASNAQCK